MAKEYIERDAVAKKAICMHGFGNVKYVPLSVIMNQTTADVVEAPQWIPVTERLPEDENPVLVYYGFMRKEGIGSALRYTGTLSYFCFDPQPHWQHEGTGLIVTHWMPLPKPPESDPTKERLLRSCEQIIKAYEDGGAEND